MRLPRREERPREARASAGRSASARRRSARLSAAGLRFFCLFAAIAALRAPGLSLPFYWDEAGAYIAPSLEVARDGLWTALPGCHRKGLLFGHPPLLYLLHGGLFQIFGAEIWIHRSARVAFAALAVWFTFRLGALLGSRATGITAAVLLLASPMFFAQSTAVLGDLPLAAFGAASFYFLFARRPLAYAVAATLLVQSKETGLAILVAAALHDALRPAREAGERKSVAMHAVPISSLLIFYLLEYLGTGSFVQASNFDGKSVLAFDLTKPREAIEQIARAASWVAHVLLVGEGRFFFTGIVAAALLWAPRAFRRPELTTLALTIALYWGAFSLIVFLPRYLIPVLPCLCVLTAVGLDALSRGHVAARAAITALAVATALPYFFFASESGTFETNLRHERAVAISREAAAYAEAALGDAVLVTDWPFTRYLTVPELGYVSRALPHVRAAHEVRRPLADIPRRRRIALLHASMAPTPEMAALRGAASAAGFTVLRRFAGDELVVEILVREASSD